MGEIGVAVIKYGSVSRVTGLGLRLKFDKISGKFVQKIYQYKVIKGQQNNIFSNHFCGLVFQPGFLPVIP